MMKIIRTSPFSGITRTREFDISPTEYQAWVDGTVIQDAMPNLNPSEREFIMTGITDTEWDDFFGVDEPHDNEI